MTTETQEDKGFCTECGQNMKSKWPLIVDKLQVCPDCCQKKARKLTYFGISQAAKARIA